MNKTIGVLALQGSFREHAEMLKKLNHDVVLIRSIKGVYGVSACIVPVITAGTKRLRPSVFEF